MGAITSEEALRRVYKEPSDRVRRKQLERLDRHCRRFVELSPFVILATSDADGSVDATPRGGPPGFVRVADERTLLIPDRPGNNRLDSLTNLVANPGVGLLFLVPGVDETLRVNGTVEISDDEGLRSLFQVDGRLPATVLVVSVREAFLHCAKALMRSRLWDQEARVERTALPTMGEMLKDQIGLDGEPESQQAMLERYRSSPY
jgi:PPOX class probable FMN-dependent enzyme